MVVVVVLTALIAAGLTLISGFGLGSLLLPAFALFLPLKVAVAATAVVHLANNVFKAGLVGRFADWRVVLAFGIPGALAAFAGASLLTLLSDRQPISTWHLGEKVCEVTPDGLAIGGLVFAFALFELLPFGRKLAFHRRWLPVGGLLSGFLGGLSGHQGALRSAFLLRLSLAKEAYIGTGTMCAIIIDCVRIPTYGLGDLSMLEGVWDVVLAGTVAAFVGSYIGRRLMHKVTMEGIHLLVGVLLVLLGGAIAAGLV